jgi:phosphate transport system substrate-binding protein
VVAAGPAPVESIVRRAAELFLEPCPEVELTVDRFDEELGFALLCTGMADVVGAARPPNDDERELCATAGIEVVSVPLATEALVVVISQADPDLSCLSFSDLYALLGPESVGFDRWSDGAELAAALGGRAEYPNAPLEIFGPVDSAADRLAFEEIVLAATADARGTEAQVRPDLIGWRDVSEMVGDIGESERGIGWMPYDLAVANADTVTTVPLRADSDHECVIPTADTIADGSYPASRRLEIWVAVDASDTVQAFVDYLYGTSYPVVVGSANGASGYLTLPASEREPALEAWHQY